MSPATHTYDQLDASPFPIRMLTLAPSEDHNEDIHGSLSMTELEGTVKETATYEALSFAWDNPSKTHTLYIGGGLLGITQNLDVDVRHPRHASMPRDIWVDDVCTDQSDIPEKIHQIRRMCSVYSGASQLLVWLNGTIFGLVKHSSLSSHDRVKSTSLDDPALTHQNRFAYPYSAVNKF